MLEVACHAGQWLVKPFVKCRAGRLPVRRPRVEKTGSRAGE